jgi:hypothetical protein
MGTAEAKDADLFSRPSENGNTFHDRKADRIVRPHASIYQDGAGFGLMRWEVRRRGRSCHRQARGPMRWCHRNDQTNTDFHIRRSASAFVASLFVICGSTTRPPAASTILEFYVNEGPKIFSTFGSFASLRQLRRSKYDPDPLRDAVSHVFGERLLGDSKTRLIIPAFDSTLGTVRVFKTSHQCRPPGGGLQRLLLVTSTGAIGMTKQIPISIFADPHQLSSRRFSSFADQLLVLQASNSLMISRARAYADVCKKEKRGRWHDLQRVHLNVVLERVRENWWGQPPSGNRAFDDYRAETLRRLEDEQREFNEFLKRLRVARDRAEFDQFTNDRRLDTPSASRRAI